MSVVVAAAYHDCAVLTSDSRVTISRKNEAAVVRDELRKVFKIADYLAVGFTSDNVDISCKIIKALAKYSLETARSRNALFLINELSRVAAYQYKQLTGPQNRPRMEFVFAGVVNDRTFGINQSELLNFIKTNMFEKSIPRYFMPALLPGGDGRAYFGPPVSLIGKISFPEFQRNIEGPFSIIASGSGVGVMEDLKNNIQSVLFPEDLNMRVGILHFALREYFEKHKIASVGGLNQTVIVDGQGIRPINYSFGRIGAQGDFLDHQKMQFENGEWVQIDASGKKFPVREFDPLSILEENQEFAGAVLVS